MKTRILTLNCWGGKVFEPLMELVEAVTADILCFQEVPMGTRPEENVRGIRDNLIQELQTRLPNFTMITHSLPVNVFQGEETLHGTNVGMAVFVRPGWRCEAIERLKLYAEDTEHAKTPGLSVTGHLLGVRVQPGSPDIPFIVGNVHGLWHRLGKVDVPERLEQSRRLLAFVEKYDLEGLPVVLAGDFNLALNLESTRLLETRLTNLVREFDIPTTRTSLYKPAYPGRDPHADYIFTSRNYQVSDCWVIPDAVSDHSPVLADIQI